jgi:hypothetical protein
MSSSIVYIGSVQALLQRKEKKVVGFLPPFMFSYCFVSTRDVVLTRCFAAALGRKHAIICDWGLLSLFSFE